MYGRGAGSVATTAGIAMLPDTGSSHRIFALATALVIVGIAILVASTVLARKSQAKA